MSYTVVNREELFRDGESYEFQGYLHGDNNLSIILVDVPPGGGPKLHKHPYEEVFVSQMTPLLKPGACGRAPPQLSIPREACCFGFVVRHIRGI